MIDISKEEHAYFLGFIHGDGHLHRGTGNKGTLSIEIAYRDIDILYKMQKLFNVNSYISSRIVSTNFKNDYHSCALKIHDLAFRNSLESVGMSYGKKSSSIAPPFGVNAAPYLRGLIDADGSLGFSATGKPFISLCTQSELMKDYYVKFICEELGYTPSISRNSRDSVYNIMIMGSRSKLLVDKLYNNDLISLDRKKAISTEILKWDRADGLRKEAHPKRWTESEDMYVKSHSTADSMAQLGRSKLSINMRKWRLNK